MNKKRNIHCTMLMCGLLAVCITAASHAQQPTTLFKALPDVNRALTVSERTAYSSFAGEDVKEKTLIQVSDLRQLEHVESFQISLANTVYTLTNDGWRHEKEGVYTLHTSFKAQHGMLALYSTNGYVYGNIHLDSLSYQIEPISEKYAVLLRRDYSGHTCPVHGDHTEDEQNEPDPPHNQQQAVKGGSIPVIDVMVVFSNQAAAATSNMQALAEASIQSSNNTFSNSNARVRFNLVHYRQINYNDTGNSLTDVNRLAGTSDGYMDHIHRLRNQYRADVVMLMVNNLNACGRARIIGANSNLAFAVTKSNCSVGNYTFAHEVGHLAGARHDNDRNFEPYLYGHGYKYVAAYWRTVMAVYDPSVSRIPFWSNPGKHYGGVAMGTTLWNDNVRVWNQRAAAMADFKTLPPPPPPPRPLSVSIAGNDFIGAGHSQTWTAWASGGVPPYRFTWYLSYVGASGPWSFVGSGSSYTQTPTRDMWLRLTARDATSIGEPIYRYAEDILKVRVLTCQRPPCAHPKAAPEAVEPVQEFALHANYPNPFNPSTTLSFDLPEPSNVSLKIFNLMGQQVAVLAEGSMEAGRYTKTFDAANLASGVYFARFEAVGNSGKVVTKSMNMQLIK